VAEKPRRPRAAKRLLWRRNSIDVRLRIVGRRGRKTRLLARVIITHRSAEIELGNWVHREIRLDAFAARLVDVESRAARRDRSALRWTWRHRRRGEVRRNVEVVVIRHVERSLQLDVIDRLPIKSDFTTLGVLRLEEWIR